jgi:leucyl-tRNA synthetase
VTASKKDQFNTIPLHVDISIVDNDKLDTKAFKNWREEYATAEFILEDDGSYVCGTEVEKMSKSKFNVQTPDELVEKFGADTLRMYEMFLGPIEQAKPWDTKGINGVHNFLRKFWRLFHQGEDNAFVVSEGEASKDALKTLHKTIQKVTSDLERFSFNTGVSNFMIATNELGEQKCNNREILTELVVLLSPYAPHICEELWVPRPLHSDLYLDGVDIVLNGSGSHFEIGKLDRRKELINEATKRSGGVYAYSNLKGGDGQRLYFEGASIISVNGELLE